MTCKWVAEMVVSYFQVWFQMGIDFTTVLIDVSFSFDRWNRFQSGHSFSFFKRAKEQLEFRCTYFGEVCGASSSQGRIDFGADGQISSYQSQNFPPDLSNIFVQEGVFEWF